MSAFALRRTARAFTSTSFLSVRCLRTQPLSLAATSARSSLAALARVSSPTTFATRRWASMATATARQPSSTLSSAEEVEPAEEATSTGALFSSLEGKVSNETLRAITVKPFQHTHMTPVQEAVLSLLPELSDPAPEKPQRDDPARDLLVRAKTGTGKTLAFLVPVIEARLKSIEEAQSQALLDADVDEAADPRKARSMRNQISRRMEREVGTVIISPTRELATQIANEAKKLSTNHDFGVQLFVGGVGKREQMYQWRRDRRDIVVATPGRMLDLLNNEMGFKESIGHAKTLVLDEADTLLDMGFRDDIEQINDFLKSSPERQTFMFSATVSPAIRQIARSTLDRNHHYIDAVDDSDSSPVHAHIPQYHTVVEAKDQISHVLRLIAHDQLLNPYNSKVILFLPTTKMTQLYAEIMSDLSASLPARRETKVYEIHSQRSQAQRSTASDRFRADTSGASVLVTSDVSARGVDYPNVTRVIQLGIPSSPEQYVHRVGRTGRGTTKTGRGDLILSPWESRYVSTSLSAVPMKPVTVEQIKAEVTTLAAEFDANPPSPLVASRDNTRSSSQSRGGRSNPFNTSRTISFRTPMSPHLEEIEPSIANYLPRLDPETIDGTFTALIGYYAQNAGDLRVSRQAVLQGLKDWTTETCGLAEAPHLSDQFLQKMGMYERSGGSGRKDMDRRRNNYTRSAGGGGGGGYGGPRDYRDGGRGDRYGGGGGGSRSTTNFSSRRGDFDESSADRRTFRPVSGRGNGGYQRSYDDMRQRQRPERRERYEN